LVSERLARNDVLVEVELMEYFYSGGGNNRPSFPYAFVVKTVTNEMWTWCENYPLSGPFERWHVQHSSAIAKLQDPIIQFESKKAAYLFRIAYSEYIIENKSIYELDNIR
jgi:hypothetical protein